jgi:uncharacterized protein YkwD
MKSLKLIIATLTLLLSINGISQKPTDYIPDLSEKSSSYCEQLFIEKLNKERVKLGKKPLAFDTLLAPAGDHHALYMRKLGKLTHWEDDDVEGMEELQFLNSRLNILDRTKIEDLSEAIGTGVIILGKEGEWNSATFNSCSDHFIKLFSNSTDHWGDLTNTNWDCIYVVIDFLNDGEENPLGSGMYITVIVGKYTDEYKIEKGVK